MNADVEKAVGALCCRADKGSDHFIRPSNAEAVELIRQALRDQEAEIAKWSSRATHELTAYHEAVMRAEKAEAMLQECREFLVNMPIIEPSQSVAESQSLHDRITTHFGATHD